MIGMAWGNMAKATVPSPVTFSITNPGTQNGIVFQISGIATPGDSIVLYNAADDTRLCDAVTADGGGNWSAWVGMPNASYTIYAKRNSVNTSASRSFTVSSAGFLHGHWLWGNPEPSPTGYGIFDPWAYFDFNKTDNDATDFSGSLNSVQVYHLIVKSGPNNFALWTDVTFADADPSWQIGGSTARAVSSPGVIGSAMTPSVFNPNDDVQVYFCNQP